MRRHGRKTRNTDTMADAKKEASRWIRRVIKSDRQDPIPERQRERHMPIKPEYRDKMKG